MRILKLEQPGCPPCKFVSNFLNDKGVEFEVVDVTEQPEVASEYGVMGVPVTILLDEEGKEVQRSVGFNPEQLENIVAKL